MGITQSCKKGVDEFFEATDNPPSLSPINSISNNVNTLTYDSYPHNFNETIQTTKELKDGVLVINKYPVFRNRTYIDTLKNLTYIDIA